MLSNIPTTRACSFHFMILSSVLQFKGSSILEALEILDASCDNRLKFTLEKGSFTPNSKTAKPAVSTTVIISSLILGIQRLPVSTQMLVSVQYPLRDVPLRQVVKHVRRNGVLFEQVLPRRSRVGRTGGNTFSARAAAFLIAHSIQHRHRVVHLIFATVRPAGKKQQYSTHS